MTAVPKPRLTPEQYLAIERKAEVRSELFDGRMVLMPVTNVWHSVIKLNCIGQIGMQLKGGPCHSYSTDMRLKVPRTDSYAYPDIFVVCGEPQPEDAEDDTLLNPRVIIEIHAPATEAYDCGKKLHHYQQIDSLHEYVLVAQAEPVVDRYVR